MQKIGTNMLNKPVVGIVVLLVAMLAYIYWPQEEAQSKRRMGGGAKVELSAVKQILFRDEISALGNAQANESVTLMAQATDRVKAVFFEDGDRVTKAQQLVSLEHSEEQAQVLELQISLAEQKRQLQRLLDIEKKSAPAQSAIDSQKSLMETTRAKLEVANVKLNEKFINAPFAGVLGLRQISPGQLVTNSTQITTLDDISQIKVEFQLPEKFLNSVVKGQKVSAKNVAYVEPFSGVINSISPRVDKVTRSFKVRALFDNQDEKLKPGMLLQLKVETSARQVLVVPESSIVPMNDQHFVFVANDNKVARTPIEIGRRKPGMVEVLSGLTEGQQVVAKGVLKLRDGASIKTGDKQQVAKKG